MAPSVTQRRRLAIAAAAAITAGSVITAASSSTATAVDNPAGSGWTGVVSSPTDPTIRLAPMATTDTASTRTITIDLEATHQTWLGVGAALTDSSVALLEDDLDAQQLLFDQSDLDGAHLNLVRLPLSATDFSTDYWTWNWNNRRKRATPSSQALSAIDVAHDIDTIATGLSIVATPWTAPSSMKTTRRLDGGALRRQSVGAYGDLLAAQASYLVDAGLPLRAVTVVNEPGHSSDYPTMTMTDSQLVDVAERIDAELDAIDVELWAVDHNWSDRDRVDNVVDAASTAWDAAAFHCYGGSPSQMAGLPIPAIITECTGTDDTWAGTFAWDARNLVVDAAESGSTGLMMWNLALDPDHGPKAPGGCGTCRGLVTIDPSTGSIDPTPEFFTLAHVARAAQPGAVRADTTHPDDTPAVAFIEPDGSVGLFGHNDSGTDQVVVVLTTNGTSQRFAVPAGALFTLNGPTTPVQVTASDIVVAGDGSRWFIADGADGLIRQSISSPQAFACDAARGGNLVDVDLATIESLQQGPNRSNVDCILRAPEGDAHVVNEAGLRQWIPDGDTWFCELDRGLEVIETSRSYIDALGEGDWRSCS